MRWLPHQLHGLTHVHSAKNLKKDFFKGAQNTHQKKQNKKQNISYSNIIHKDDMRDFGPRFDVLNTHIVGYYLKAIIRQKQDMVNTASLD